MTHPELEAVRNALHTMLEQIIKAEQAETFEATHEAVRDLKPLAITLVRDLTKLIRGWL